MAKAREAKTVDAYEMKAEDKELYAGFCTRVIADGFVPAEILRNAFGDEAYTRCIAVLFRTWRMFREVRRKWTDGNDAPDHRRRWPHGFGAQAFRVDSVRYGVRD